MAQISNYDGPHRNFEKAGGPVIPRDPKVGPKEEDMNSAPRSGMQRQPENLQVNLAKYDRPQKAPDFEHPCQ